MKRRNSFQNLIAWQKSRILTRKVYEVSRKGEFHRDFDLRSQIRRSAVSVMNNIAEGYARGTPNQFSHFLDISWGAAAEVQSLLVVARDLNYIDEDCFDEFFQLSDETISIIAGLKRKIKRSS